MTNFQFSATAHSIVPNIFERSMSQVAAARAAGADVIDLSVGNPDAYPAQFIRDTARNAIDIPANSRYTPFDGKKEFLEAAASWYEREHDVHLDPTTQLFAVEGAVDGLAAVFNILAEPGTTVAFVEPYYPSYHCMTTMLGATELRLPAKRELGFLPDLNAITPDQWDNVNLLVLNYPNNPTGAQAPREFFEQCIALAKQHGFAILHDFAYAGLAVHETQPSFLSVPGAIDVGVEVCSLSKMYGMAGWRGGFLAGNPDILHYAREYHYQMGSMITSFVQDAGTAALASDQSCVASQAARYRARRDLVDAPLRELGFDVFDARGGIYSWVHAPEGQTGADFAATLLERASVAVLDGACFGEEGRDWVRISLLQPEDRLAEAVERLAALAG